MTSQASDLVYVGQSAIDSFGLFAAKEFSPKERIIKIDGEIINSDECEYREEIENNVYIFYWNDDKYVDVKNTKLKYLNHSCNPNAIVTGNNENLFITAKRSIKIGEEITIDYDYDEIYNSCKCLKCRQIIMQFY